MNKEIQLTSSGCQAGLPKSKSKTKRLSRSFRQQSQRAPPLEADPPKSFQTEFKTPTQKPRSKYISGFTGESPQNDSDYQQDIVWDATSPSPVRAVKRGKNRAASAGISNISEIVRRIAPKHGRPEVVEPTLQQWIGDGADIPCTPDVQHPKAKKKSPRPNRVEDLLKLAKQFDLNVFQQDEEEEAEDTHQHTLDLLSDSEGELLPSFAGDSPPATVKAQRKNSQACELQDHHMEEDLDFLFNETTQSISGNLSQISLVQSTEVKPASTVACKEASKKASGPSCGTTSTGSTAHVKDVSTDNDFDDDWENDDLLNDSLVFELTQNLPHHFAPPKHCSTQRATAEKQCQRDYPRGVPVIGSVGKEPYSRVGPFKAEASTMTNRRTFTLEANPAFPVNRGLRDSSENRMSLPDLGNGTSDQAAQQSGTSSCKYPETGLQRNRKAQHSNGLKSSSYLQFPFVPRTSVTSSSAEYSLSTASTSNSSAPKAHPMRPQHVGPSLSSKPATHKQAPAATLLRSNGDFLDEDLDALFSPDPVWDDQGDDDLLCKMCMDLESQPETVKPAYRPLSVSQVHNQIRAPAAPMKVAFESVNQQTDVTVPQHISAGLQLAPALGVANCMRNAMPSSLAPGSGRTTVGSFAGDALFIHKAIIENNTGKESTLKGGSSQRSEMQSTGVPKTTAEVQSQFTFKKPPNSVAKVTDKGKCSAAEIELKKRQALERRRQRLQATQDLRVPT